MKGWTAVRSLELSETQQQDTYMNNWTNVHHILANYMSVMVLGSFPYNGPEMIYYYPILMYYYLHHPGEKIGCFCNLPGITHLINEILQEQKKHLTYNIE